ncbi:hypothetical protein P5673_026853 [Acropora cervicornis]|uniref:Uncharacterized protein n=1 Tax=Acropora cervicornis TaxID=6130 RepID=A0AAD9PZS0_ACRCE|nr:hypothetical protein P5673_026853 [Acropora cervicornis]
MKKMTDHPRICTTRFLLFLIGHFVPFPVH